MTKNKFTVNRNRENGSKAFGDYGERGEKVPKPVQGNPEENQDSTANGRENKRTPWGRMKRGTEEKSERSDRGREEENPEYEGEYEDWDRADFENEKNQYLAEKLEFQAKKALSEENLPVSFAKLLCGENEDETLENIAVFKEEFLKAIEAALSERLKGSTPKTSAGTVEYDPFLRGFGY